MKIGNIIKCKNIENLNKIDVVCGEKNGTVGQRTIKSDRDKIEEKEKEEKEKGEEEKGGKEKESQTLTLEHNHRIQIVENDVATQNINNSSLSKRDRLVGVSCPLSYFLDDESCVRTCDNNLGGVRLSDFIDRNECRNVRFSVCTTSTDNTSKGRDKNENMNGNKFIKEDGDIENNERSDQIEDDSGSVDAVSSNNFGKKKRKEEDREETEIKNKSKNKDENEIENEKKNSDKKSFSIPWVLDICLDYFSTLNPFLPELEKNVREDCDNFTGEEIDKSSSDKVIQIILNSFKFMKVRCLESDKKYTKNNSKIKLDDDSIKSCDEFKEKELVSNLNDDLGGCMSFDLICILSDIHS